MDKIGIIIINYCGYELTVQCIDSIKKSANKNCEIYVVDNASPDGSGKMFLNRNDIHFIQSPNNLGFAAGNNLGIKRALRDGCNYIMLLNNDTVIEKNMIDQLYEKCNVDTVAVPKMYYFDYNGRNDIIWYAGGYIEYKSSDGIHIGGKKEDRSEYSYEKYVDFATGCCFMIHKATIKKIGLLREEYFMYCEDTDYSIRMNKNNIKILYVPSAILWHKVSSSSGGEMSKFIIYYLVRNKMYCAKINRLGNKTYIYIIAETIYRIVKAKLGRYYRNYPIGFWGLIDGLNNNMGKTKRNLVSGKD